MERQCGARIQEKIRKLNLLKSIVNDPSSDTSTSNTNSTPSSVSRHTMKLRTFTAPATAPRPAPAPRKPVGKLPGAKSMHDLNQIGSAPKSVSKNFILFLGVDIERLVSWLFVILFWSQYTQGRDGHFNCLGRGFLQQCFCIFLLRFWMSSLLLKCLTLQPDESFSYYMAYYWFGLTFMYSCILCF